MTPYILARYSQQRTGVPNQLQSRISIVFCLKHADLPVIKVDPTNPASATLTTDQARSRQQFSTVVGVLLVIEKIKGNNAFRMRLTNLFFNSGNPLINVPNDDPSLGVISGFDYSDRVLLDTNVSYGNPGAAVATGYALLNKGQSEALMARYPNIQSYNVIDQYDTGGNGTALSGSQLDVLLDELGIEVVPATPVSENATTLYLSTPDNGVEAYSLSQKDQAISILKSKCMTYNQLVNTSTDSPPANSPAEKMKTTTPDTTPFEWPASETSVGTPTKTDPTPKTEVPQTPPTSPPPTKPTGPTPNTSKDCPTTVPKGEPVKLPQVDGSTVQIDGDGQIKVIYCDGTEAIIREGGCDEQPKEVDCEPIKLPPGEYIVKVPYGGEIVKDCPPKGSMTRGNEGLILSRQKTGSTMIYAIAFKRGMVIDFFQGGKPYSKVAPQDKLATVEMDRLTPYRIKNSKGETVLSGFAE